MPRSPAAERSVAQSDESAHAFVNSASGSSSSRHRDPPYAPARTDRTKKLLERYGERLVCVRYRYDAQNSRRHKTVELIVETIPWRPNARRARRRDEEIIAVRIAYAESELRARAKRLGAIWRPQQRLWEMRWLDAKRLGISDRVQRVSPL